VVDKNGESFVVLKSELTKFYASKNFININENLTSIGKKFIDLASANVSRIKNKITNKIKGFIS
jgi:phage-related holin